LWDTFLLQMDDFDRLLEFQLRRKLDGVVVAPVPVRRGRAGSGRMTKGRREDAANKPMGVIPIQLRPDTFIFVEHS
jgi:ribosomal protein L15E